MTSPQELIDLARRGPVPADWRVFTKPRGVVGAFFRGTSGQPDPVLVITPEAAVEYVSDKVSLAILPFDLVAEAKLRARATATAGAQAPDPVISGRRHFESCPEHHPAGPVQRRGGEDADCAAAPQRLAAARNQSRSSQGD